MVSFQTLQVFPNQRKMVPHQYENSSKKRRWNNEAEEEEVAKEDDLDEKRSKTTSKNEFDIIELHLEQRPLPLEWQRCLDIQSGKIHFYNTRTEKRTFKDPRHMSLDLELNLSIPYESELSIKTTHSDDHNWAKNEPVRRSTISSAGLSSLELDQQQPEMVATVCQRCHMLVMLCKSSPACPSCKFMHPPDQPPPSLFKRHRLLCCKD